MAGQLFGTTLPQGTADPVRAVSGQGQGQWGDGTQRDLALAGSLGGHGTATQQDTAVVCESFLLQTSRSDSFLVRAPRAQAAPYHRDTLLSP